MQQETQCYQVDSYLHFWVRCISRILHCHFKMLESKGETKFVTLILVQANK